MMLEILILLIVLPLAVYALHSYWHGGNRLDLFYAVAMLPWVGLIAFSLLAEEAWLAHDGRYGTLLIHQFTIVGLSAFLLQSIDDLKRPQTIALIAQALLGSAIAAAPLLGFDSQLKLALPGVWAPGWVEVNILFATLLLIRLTLQAWRGQTPEGWMVLLVTILGLGFIIGDVSSAASGVAKPSISDCFFAVALLLLWLILTRRIGASRWQFKRPPGQTEPEQFALDLHDGVGSHLATIIAGLEIDTPQRRATAMALQHCLLELKMLVDGEGQDRSVIEHLACLRYRLQPMLQSAGIEMSWQVSDEDELEQLHGDAARQVLRVAQEALANAVRHSGAREVAVVCAYAKPEHALILEISDNGVGLPPNFRMSEAQTRPAGNGRCGKGLDGMAWRARRLGGKLLIGAARGQGTCVRLQLPIAVWSGTER